MQQFIFQVLMHTFIKTTVFRLDREIINAKGKLKLIRLTGRKLEPVLDIRIRNQLLAYQITILQPCVLQVSEYFNG